MDPLTRVALTILAGVRAPGIELAWAETLIARWNQFIGGQLDPLEVALGTPGSLRWLVYAMSLLRQATNDHGPNFNQPANLRATRTKLLQAAHQAPSPFAAAAPNVGGVATRSIGSAAGSVATGTALGVVGDESELDDLLPPLGGLRTKANPAAASPRSRGRPAAGARRSRRPKKSP
jgi:hypothetical protein